MAYFYIEGDSQTNRIHDKKLIKNYIILFHFLYLSVYLLELPYYFHSVLNFSSTQPITLIFSTIEFYDPLVFFEPIILPVIHSHVSLNLSDLFFLMFATIFKKSQFVLLDFIFRCSICFIFDTNFNISFVLFYLSCLPINLVH